jgi:tRNA pseudouridine13 synthase
MSIPFSEHTSQLPQIHQKPTITGSIRQHYSDFEVTETLSFEPCGEGEHLFLYIEKHSCNSQWVADELQKHFKLRSQDIGYAGKKDKASISRQWFSCHLPGKEKAINQSVIDDLSNDSYKILKSTRHNKKLRKGVIKNNQFKIKISDLSGEINSETLDKIQTIGFPNYFGYQRFGHSGNNLTQALKLFKNEIRVRSRNKKGLYLSAARSYLFNLMVAQRIIKDCWNKALLGDCLSLAGSHSYFICEKVDSEINNRLNTADVQISGLLVGGQKSQAQALALEIENSVLADYEIWTDGLESARLTTSRRNIRVIPENFKFSLVDEQTSIIEFSLPAGSFATSLLRELFVVNDAATRHHVSQTTVPEQSIDK